MPRKHKPSKNTITYYRNYGKSYMGWQKFDRMYIREVESWLRGNPDHHVVIAGRKVTTVTGVVPAFMKAKATVKKSYKKNPD